MWREVLAGHREVGVLGGDDVVEGQRDLAVVAPNHILDASLQVMQIFFHPGLEGIEGDERQLALPHSDLPNNGSLAV